MVGRRKGGSPNFFEHEEKKGVFGQQRPVGGKRARTVGKRKTSTQKKQWGSPKGPPRNSIDMFELVRGPTVTAS